MAEGAADEGKIRINFQIYNEFSSSLNEKI